MQRLQGTVREWHAGEGWGVIDSPSTPGGCWTHYSAVLVAGYRALESGDEVVFTWEAVDQDGYAYRAVEAWPADREPVRQAPTPPRPSDPFGSSLTISSDPDPGRA